jgi:hypothetical protein
MKAKRHPKVLANRIPHDREEFLGIHFASGASRDSARELWQAIEDAFAIDLRGLHPDDDLGHVLPSGRLADVRSLGSFRRCVDLFAKCPNALAKVEFVMSLEQSVYERRSSSGGSRP